MQGLREIKEPEEEELRHTRVRVDLDDLEESVLGRGRSMLPPQIRRQPCVVTLNKAQRWY